MNIIEMYLKYTEPHEAKTIFHLWSFLSVCASILSGRCWSTLGYGILKPNLFIILTGPPASRKSAAIETAMEMIDPLLDNDDLVLSSESITFRGLTKELVASNKSFTVGDETVNYMNLFASASELTSFLDTNDKKLMNFMLEAFDGKIRRHRHSTASCGSDEMRNISINLLAGTTKKFLQDHTFSDHVESGFASRLLFLMEDQRRFNNPDPELDFELKNQIIRKLFQLTTITGYIPFLGKGKEEFVNWYKTQPLGIDKTVPSSMIPYAGRRQTYVRKLSLIMWCLEYIEDMSLERIVQARHVTQALKLIKGAEQHIRKAYDTSGRSPDILSINEIEAYFKERENTFISKKQIYEHFHKDVTPQVLDSILDNMVINLKVLKFGVLPGKGEGYKYVGKQE